MRAQATTAAKWVVVLATALAWACDHGSVKAAWEEVLRPILPAVYEGFAVEINGYDNGVRIFSFAVGAGSDGQRVLQELKDRIRQQYPCYELTASSDHLMRMECARPADRYERIRRIEFVLDSGAHRMLGMTISNDQSAALQQEYEETLLSLAHREPGAR
jgi:hypothetical protein